MEKNINFQQEMKRLEKIVNDIQKEDISLDESIKLFEEGQKIIEVLSKELKEAESKVEKIIEINK